MREASGGREPEGTQEKCLMPSSLKSMSVAQWYPGA